MPEDGPDHRGLGEEGEDPHLTVAGWAPEGVHLVDPRKELRPATTGAAVGCVVAPVLPSGGLLPASSASSRPAGGLSSPPGVRRKDAMVAMPVDARRWNQANEPIDQLEGAKADPGASVVCGAG